jgi:predicted pyridoxine 5'-phosphate oxidase superfamily flavin-nucleotide-binding protein
VALSPGADRSGDREGARADARLDAEEVAWLITVAPDGTPSPTPVWFLWDGEYAVPVRITPTKLRQWSAASAG